MPTVAAGQPGSGNTLATARAPTEDWFDGLIARLASTHYIAVHREAQEMDVQVTVRMDAELKQAIDRAAAKMRRKPSEIVRMALQAFLEGPGPVGQRPFERVRDLIGSIDSGVPDLAERHREYVLGSLKHGR